MNYINTVQPTHHLLDLYTQTIRAYNLLQKTLFPKDTMMLKLKFTAAAAAKSQR